MRKYTLPHKNKVLNCVYLNSALQRIEKLFMDLLLILNMFKYFIIDIKSQIAQLIYIQKYFVYEWIQYLPSILRIVLITIFFHKNIVSHYLLNTVAYSLA